ncbi:NADH:flavin oxidoreductase/NADH oxidase family protein [Litoreibacter roseus]|uniref:2,4-dienoyl-CoA reductase n=1 Tax=Litoreibacter roseus TaxID=2601869 RepID=A0A6N6JHA5_9RHOB|nr:NADH:flavin oxidoreductase/NADH oxidase family protein [Litoreibacter roseus]GFE64668.1 2,4-dienoyl-CoA reductase [Litoreibacter roseus]
MTADRLFEDLHLPNGSVLSNRIAKAAMEENLADWGQVPGERLQTLYRRWAASGASLLITGNVMVAPDALTGPGGVVLDHKAPLDPFREWAKAGRTNGSQFWMQINHPGRQVYADMGEDAVSASDVAVNIPGFSKLFAKPRALNAGEIASLIEAFATTASRAEEAGFTGVEIHAAHGYLLSQFLSPLTNQRTDQWGGSLENRARLLFDVVAAVRNSVAPGFCVAVKLNSADFQKGGFDAEDAKWVVAHLNGKGVDLVELSGGSYESPAMQGRSQTESTVKREAYFVEFARDIAQVAEMPLMITGGITRIETARAALADDTGVAMLGLARAFAFAPDLVNGWKDGTQDVIHVPQVTWKNRALAGLATMALAKEQLERMAVGASPNPGVFAPLALIKERFRTAKRTKTYKRWRATDGAG